MTLKRVLLCGLACALIVLACGPMFREAVFTYTSYPRYPERNFASGELGIVYPTFWRKFLVVAWRNIEGPPLTAAEQRAFIEGPPRNPWQRTLWKNVRTERELPGGNFQSFVNCGEDAFRRAEEKLAELKRQFGDTHAGVKSWLQAQDTVFSNCEGGEKIPQAIEPGQPTALARERQYQIAAANFYAMKYDIAELQFRGLGDSYLVARCLIRRGTIGPLNRQDLQNAERELRKLGDPPLLGFIASKLRPEEHRIELAKRLNDPKQEAAFAQSLTDYTWLLDRETASFSGDEMTEWIDAVQSGRGEPVERWKRTHKPVWLLAALLHAQPGAQQNAELLEAARSVPASSPAYATARYHRVRLLLASADRVRARKELDEILKQTLPVSAVNAFKAQRMQVAENVAEWVAFAPRQPVAWYYYGEYEAGQEDLPAVLFDSDAALQANRGLPLSLLQRAAAETQLPAALREQLGTVTRTRRILLSGGSYDEIYQVLRTPSMTPYVTAGINRRDAAPTAIDNYRANWWCAWTKDEKTAIPMWLPGAAKAEAAKELAALQVMPSAPTWLARRAVQLANAAPQDPRNAELLHLAVRATRYGCTDDANSAASKAAFQVLHRRYPKSEWARKTPYSF